MSKIKMICLDIDGTLLNSEHKISEKTKRAIQIAANDRKIPVILVSGRMPKGIVFLQQELKIAEPIICYSGCLTLAHDNTILANQVIPISQFANIYKVFQNRNVHLSLFKDDEWSQQEFKITNIKPNYQKFNELFKLWQKNNTGPNKMLCMAEPATINFLKENITDDNLTIYPSKSTYLENSLKNNCNWFLTKKHQIKQSDILAIGDHYNDIDMLSYAGFGIAMDNAPDDVKKYAGAITSSNDEDGVAVALEKYVLI